MVAMAPRKVSLLDEDQEDTVLTVNENYAKRFEVQSLELTFCACNNAADSTQLLMLLVTVVCR